MTSFKAQVDDTGGNLELRFVSDDGAIEMGAYRVLFGYRIRACRVGTQEIALDWCCAADPMLAVFTHSIMKKLLEADKFKALPGFSMVKPWILDKDFIDKVQAVIDSTEIGIRLDTLVPMFTNAYNAYKQIKPNT